MNYIFNVFYIFLAVTLFAALYEGIKSVYYGFKSTYWPWTRGKIIQSGIEIKSDEDGKSYNAKIVYSYVVDDKTFKSENLKWGGLNSTFRSTARKTTGLYHLEKQVRVFYDSKNPSKAVLEPGLKAEAFTPVIIAGSVLLMLVKGLFF